MRHEPAHLLSSRLGMLQWPSRTVIAIVSLCVANTLACSRNNSDSFNPDESALYLDRDPHPPRTGASNDDWLGRAKAAASAQLEPPDPFEEATAALECPSTRDWTKFDAFAAPCTYAWTTETTKLPNPPEWQPCPPLDGLPKGACKTLKRSRRLKTFHVGARSANEIYVGFVEPCVTDQIVLADIDGPTRFALRRAENTQFPTTCQTKLLAVDQGQWLASLGSEDLPANFNTSGYSASGAFIGGTIGTAPTLLFSQPNEPFHVGTSQGSIVQEGFHANGKRLHWSGKSIEKPPRIGLVRLTKHLLLDEKKGFFIQNGTQLDPWLDVVPGAMFAEAQIRDKQIVWQEHTNIRGQKTCTLMAGELDAHERLIQPRRMGEIHCTNAKPALGCNAVLTSSDTHLSLISLTNGSLRTLRAKGHPLAVDCQQAFIERAGLLLRIDLAAFSPPKIPPTPPSDVRLNQPNSEKLH